MLFTVPEVADLLRASVHTVRRMVREGELEAIKVGSGYRIKADALSGIVDVDAIRAKLKELEAEAVTASVSTEADDLV